MLEVTDKATEMIREFFKSRDAVQPLRIFIAGAGWGGPQLGMALDEPNDNDEKFEVSDFTFLVEKQLLDEAKSITVDYIITPQGEGFIINSGVKNASDCGGCTSC